MLEFVVLCFLARLIIFGLRLRQRDDVEMKDPIAARKVKKADREKLRRDRLNEQFLELGNTLGRVLHLFSFFF